MVESLQNDRKLLQKIATDDEEAFNALFEKYKKKFYGVAIKMTPSKDIAEEIVQEVFVIIWTRRAIMNQVDNPSNYLFTILYNKIKTYLKSIAEEEKRKMRYGKEVNVGAMPKTTDPFNKTDPFHKELPHNRDFLFPLFTKLIHQLPKRQQQVFVLSKKEGLSREEIAQYLELSPHTVKNHLQEAMRYLKANANNLLTALLVFYFI